MADPGSVNSGGLKTLQDNLNDLEDLIRKSQEKQHQLRRWNQFTTLGILAVFLIFIFLFYSVIKSNFSADRFSKSIKENTVDLAPTITNASLEVLKEVQPVYVEEARIKAEEMMPEFMVALESETNIFIQEMSVYGDTEIRARLMAILENVAARFKAEYPDLTDEQLAQFVSETEDELLTTMVAISEHILDQSLPDIMEMKYLVEESARQHPEMVEEELYRLFLHKLLMLFDMELMEG